MDSDDPREREPSHEAVDVKVLAKLPEHAIV